MGKPAIEVKNVSKEYILGDIAKSSLRESIAGFFSRKNKGEQNTFWALKDIDFTVEQGEALAIIGKNGAGKSTLLKLLSRITYPTTGTIKLNGRISSLLEVGTGFHPELTGRENIFLNGTILGMTRSEIKSKFDQIVAFSGVEKFLDTPVKHYSSGMYVRLAFSVAAHLEPEILIVDEVLAVGDAEFQKKCLGKMKDVAGEGRTVIFVSHNMAAVQTFCSRGILLQGGQMSFDGPADAVVTEYLHASFKGFSYKNWNIEEAPTQNGIKLISAKINSDNDNGKIDVGSQLIFEFEVINTSDKEDLDLTFHIQDEQGNLIFVASTGFTQTKIKRGNNLLTCIIDKNVLNEGQYFINRVLIVKDRSTALFNAEDLISFEIKPRKRTDAFGKFFKKEGVIVPETKWAVQ